MKCVNPRKLPNKSSTSFNDRYIQVSCGKCYACLSNRRRGWLFRLGNEYLSSIHSFFLTLTYDDDNLPPELVKKHLQNFIKRFRHYETCTYYGIGEYGTHTHRPHYHLVLFLKSCSTDYDFYDYYDKITSLWPFGFVAVSNVTYRRLNYILHYHTRPKVIDGRKTFQIFSKGIGIDFLNQEMISYLVNTHATTIKDFNGNTYVIPRYYRKKLLEQGFQVDPPTPRIYDSDSVKEAIEKAFNRKMYQISSKAIASYLRERLQISMNKVNKYNNQDKYI